MSYEKATRSILSVAISTSACVIFIGVFVGLSLAQASADEFQYSGLTAEEIAESGIRVPTPLEHNTRIWEVVFLFVPSGLAGVYSGYKQISKDADGAS